MGEREGADKDTKTPLLCVLPTFPHQPPLSDQHSLYPNICTYHSLPPLGGTKVFNKENQRGAIPSTLTKTWRFFIRLIYDMTVIGSILMVWCDQLILLFVRTRLDWLFWQNDAGGWYHNRVGINLRYYLSNRLIRNWWQTTIQNWIWKGASLTYLIQYIETLLKMFTSLIFRLHHRELRILWQRKSVWELVTDLIRMCHTTLRGCLRFNFRIANFNQTLKIILKAAHHKQLSVSHIF